MCPHRPATWAGCRASPPVSTCESPDWAYELKQCTVRKKIFCTGSTSAAKAGWNIFYWHEKPKEPTKEVPFSHLLFEPSFASVSTVRRGHLSLVSLVEPVSTSLLVSLHALLWFWWLSVLFNKFSMPRLLELSCRLTSERIRRTALQFARIRRVGSALHPFRGYLGYGPKARYFSANNFKRRFKKMTMEVGFKNFVGLIYKFSFYNSIRIINAVMPLL